MWNMCEQNVPNSVWKYHHYNEAVQLGGDEQHERSSVPRYITPLSSSAGLQYNQLDCYLKTDTEQACTLTANPHIQSMSYKSYFGSPSLEVSQIPQTCCLHQDQRVSFCSKMGSVAVQGACCAHMESCYFQFDPWPGTYWARKSFLIHN